MEKDYAAAVEEEEKLRAEQERKRALAEAEKANGLTGERGQSAVPDPRDDVFKKSVGLYKLKESFRANLPSTHTPLSSKADLRADRVRKKVQASKPDGTAPSTPIRVQLQDNRLADMHTHLKHVWSQAMPGTLTATGQFPKKAREMLESNGLTWVLPTGVTVDHVYKKTKPIYVIRLLEKAMLNRQPARIVPKEAAPPETS